MVIFPIAHLLAIHQVHYQEQSIHNLPLQQSQLNCFLYGCVTPYLVIPNRSHYICSAHFQHQCETVENTNRVLHSLAPCFQSAPMA